MSSACKSLSLCFVLMTVVCTSLPGQEVTPPLRVCADPNNLPYSNQQRQGFENHIIELIAKDLGRQVSYFWYPQREKFFRQTLSRGVCDVVMGVPIGFEDALTTRPYYRSSYAFVSRHDRHLQLHSLDDPRLRTLSIGVHLLGDSDKSQPPVQALTGRGIVNNLVGFNIFGNLYEDNPAADLIRAVSDRRVDVAVAWGPLAGYFARHSDIPLDVTPIDNDSVAPGLPLSFDIAVGVRKGDTKLQQQLDTELVRRKADIDRIIESYGVPETSSDRNDRPKSISPSKPQSPSDPSLVAQGEK